MAAGVVRHVTAWPGAVIRPCHQPASLSLLLPPPLAAPHLHRQTRGGGALTPGTPGGRGWAGCALGKGDPRATITEAASKRGLRDHGCQPLGQQDTLRQILAGRRSWGGSHSLPHSNVAVPLLVAPTPKKQFAGTCWQDADPQSRPRPGGAGKAPHPAPLGPEVMRRGHARGDSHQLILWHFVFYVGAQK